MKRLRNLNASEYSLSPESQVHPKRKNLLDSLHRLPQRKRGATQGYGQCAECGGEVKVFVSPRRNPHSSKLGRSVSMKDHDLCRRCWRQLMHHQRQIGIVVLPRAMFIGGQKLRPRLLMVKPTSMPRQAS